MLPAALARQLSRTQCDFLIDHIDSAHPLRHDNNEDRTRSALISRNLIRYEYAPTIVGRPRATVLTQLGREVVCIVLGQYADALERARERIGRLRDKPRLSVEDALRQGWQASIAARFPS